MPGKTDAIVAAIFVDGVLCVQWRDVRRMEPCPARECGTSLNEEGGVSNWSPWKLIISNAMAIVLTSPTHLRFPVA